MIPASLDRATETLATRAVERPLQPAGAGELRVGDEVMVNMASNDYLGLARDPRVLEAARTALDTWGLGTAATRVVSGTTTIHLALEDRLARWVGCDAAVLHASCWTANAAVLGLLAALAGQAETTMAIFSDRLNHASIIDGIRAQRSAVSHLGLYAHQDLNELGRQLADPAITDAKVIVTDGVFSMEGDLAPLKDLVDLADEFGALLIVDDSHGTGVAGATGRGSAEAAGVLDRVDILTGTLGKALGGAIGGFVAGPTPLMAALRSVSRPYAFSNNPPVAVAAGALAALDILERDPEPLSRMRQRVAQLRAGVSELGLRTHPGEHPIVPIILGDEDHAHAASQQLARAGVFATPLTFPIVPRGQARLRLQVSAAHTRAAIERVLDALDRIS